MLYIDARSYVVLVRPVVWWLEREGERVERENGEGEGAAEEDREQDKQASDVLEAEMRAAEEGPRDLRPLRRRRRPHRLLHQGQALRVRHRLLHGEDPRAL